MADHDLEDVVGICMLLLGTYGLRKAFSDEIEA